MFQVKAPPKPSPPPPPRRPNPIVSVGMEVGGYGDVMVGEKARFKVFLKNAGKTVARISFPTSQRFELQISRKGTVVWTWSNSRVFTQAISEVEIKPGKKLEFEATWDQTDNNGSPVGPGVYTAKGTVTAMEKWLRLSVDTDFAVVARKSKPR